MKIPKQIRSTLGIQSRAGARSAVRSYYVQWICAQLDRLERTHPLPGKHTVKRLSRSTLSDVIAAASEISGDDPYWARLPSRLEIRQEEVESALENHRLLYPLLGEGCDKAPFETEQLMLMSAPRDGMDTAESREALRHLIEMAREYA